MNDQVDKMHDAPTYRYDHLSWPEIKDALTRQPVVILPVGATEQHGPHLPLDVDSFLVSAVCLESARQLGGAALVLPVVPYGLNLHHIDFPGTIHIEPEVFISFCVNIAKSVSYHGFQRILVVNGHGSNAPLCDIVARKIVLETPSICAAVDYAAFARDAFEAVRETSVTAHADEMETSLYLYLAPDRVRMERAIADHDRTGRWLSSDSTTSVRFNDYWGRWTRTGVHGDPRPATAEKGRVIWEAAVSGLRDLVIEWSQWPVVDRVSQHSPPARPEIRW